MDWGINQPNLYLFISLLIPGLPVDAISGHLPAVGHILTHLLTIAIWLSPLSVGLGSISGFILLWKRGNGQIWVCNISYEWHITKSWLKGYLGHWHLLHGSHICCFFAPVALHSVALDACPIYRHYGMSGTLMRIKPIKQTFLIYKWIHKWFQITDPFPPGINMYFNHLITSILMSLSFHYDFFLLFCHDFHQGNSVWCTGTNKWSNMANQKANEWQHPCVLVHHSKVYISCFAVLSDSMPHNDRASTIQMYTNSNLVKWVGLWKWSRVDKLKTFFEPVYTHN